MISQVDREVKKPEMASSDPNRSIQAGLENSKIDYFDIMVVGNTGQGKSTTSDKIIAANPDKVKYTVSQIPTDASRPPQQADGQTPRVTCTDISMWLAHGTEIDEFESHLKFLHYCRTKDKPHEEINRVRSSLARGANEVFKPTKDCEVLSNDTTKVRLMDVPGFFDGASVLARDQQPVPEGAELMSPLDMNNLDIMRKIIRIQTAVSMKFNRILYFLPTRGPLERVSAHLKLELKWMAHFFDRAIFKSMVLVATVSERFSKMDNMSNDDKFPEEDVRMTRDLFRQALKEVFKNPPPTNPVPDPPLIFLSLTDTCEEILEKIKRTTVEEEGLYLKIDENTCAECGVKIGMVKEQRVTCYFGEDMSNAIPYEESTCHPFFVPRFTRIDKIWGGFRYVVSLGWITGDPWPIFVGEKCAACGGMANRRGCMKVGSDYGKGKQKIIVDHTSEVVNTPVEEHATPITETAPPTTGESQNDSDGRREESGATEEIERDTESSMVVNEGGRSHMRVNLDRLPNQSIMVEQSAVNPVWTEGSDT